MSTILPPTEKEAKAKTSTSSTTEGSIHHQQQGVDTSDSAEGVTNIPLNQHFAHGDIYITVDGGDIVNSSSSSSSSNGAEQKPTRYVPGGKMPNQRKQVAGRVLAMVIMLIIQVGIPLALYYGLRNTIGIVYALVISGIPPVLYVISEFIRTRKIDILGCIIAVSFILSGIISIVSADPRAALIRDSAVGAVIGGMFLITLIPVRTKWVKFRPLVFIFAVQMYEGINYQWTDKNGNRKEQNVVYWQWENIRFARIVIYMQSAGWGFFLVMELIACVLMVELSDLSVDAIIMYNNIINGIVIGIMVIATIITGFYARRLEKRIGKLWTKENDFTECFDQQRQEHEQKQQRQRQQQQQQDTDIVEHHATTTV